MRVNTLSTPFISLVFRGPPRGLSHRQKGISTLMLKLGESSPPGTLKKNLVNDGISTTNLNWCEWIPDFWLPSTASIDLFWVVATQIFLEFSPRKLGRIFISMGLKPPTSFCWSCNEKTPMCSSWWLECCPLSQLRVLLTSKGWLGSEKKVMRTDGQTVGSFLQRHCNCNSNMKKLVGISRKHQLLPVQVYATRRQVWMGFSYSAVSPKSAGFLCTVGN